MKQVISASVTPFGADGNIDLESAARLYEFGLERGIDGFFIFGSMGEWALLTDEERDALAACACQVIGQKAKLLVGVSDTGKLNILRNMERLHHLTHSHWTVALPPAWTGPDGDVVKYMHEIADTADRPLYLYYAPGFNHVTLNTSQFRDILAHPKIVGVKNSAGSIQVRKELLLLKKSIEFELFEGDEWGIDEALSGGCDGAVVGFGGAGGKVVKEIASLVAADKLHAARELQFRLIDIFHSIYGTDLRWWCAGHKYALQCMGVISSATTRVDSQRCLPESHKAIVRACVDANRDLLI